jgi:hypothetical protein
MKQEEIFVKKSINRNHYLKSNNFNFRCCVYDAMQADSAA